MGWRFRKSINVARGVKINLSKGGLSTSVGGNGATVSLGKNGAYLNTSIPGTGLYHRKKLHPKLKKTKDNNSMTGCFIKSWGILSIFMVVGSIVLVATGHIKLTLETIIGFFFFLVCAIVIYWNHISKLTNRVFDSDDINGYDVEQEKTTEDLQNDIVSDPSFEEVVFKVEDDNINKCDSTDSFKTNEDVNDTVDALIKEGKIKLPSGDILDPLFYDAARLVISKQNFSVSSIQRKFTIGYNRASRLIDQLETLGVVSAFDGNSTREVLIKDECSLKNKLLEIAEKSSEETSKDKFVKVSDVIPRNLYCEVDENNHAFLRFIEELRKDTTFMAMYENTEAKIADILNLLVIKDIITCFKQLGHSLSIESLEGQCVLETYILLGINKEQNYADFQMLLTLDTLDRINARQLLQSNIYDYDKNQMVLVPGELNFLTILKYNKDYAAKYLTLLYRYMTLIVKADNDISEDETAWLNGLVKQRGEFLGSSSHRANRNEEVEEKKEIKPLQQATISNSSEELSKLIGLENVKTEVNNLTNLVKVQKMREDRGLKPTPISYHCVFTGNPGTGKTTVARIVAEIYKELGVLKSGHLVEIDRSGLVGEYVGQTAPKTNTIIDSALDGVLFIDEAYSLVQGGQNDYGKEAISTLLKRMEDDRDRLIVILAGYSKEMEDFINSNSGLQSRFNRYIEFPDYSCSELLQIFDFILGKNDFVLSDEARKQVETVINDTVEHKDKNFGNGRYVRNLFEKIITQQANRITSEPNITNEMLSTIEAVDIINATV